MQDLQNPLWKSAKKSNCAVIDVVYIGKRLPQVLGVAFFAQKWYNLIYIYKVNIIMLHKIYRRIE